ncbi:MAG: ATP-binding protein [Chlamydiae bacterium]|nr:ATP-binding protein [Chlamydiota bacterium]
MNHSYPEQVRFNAELEFLSAKVMPWVNEKILLANLVKEAKRIELALEEVIVNVIRHGYSNQSGTIELSCRIFPRRSIEFTLIDKAPSFNPLKKMRSFERIDQWQEGGLGIFFMQECMDEVHYERQHPYNILTLIKKAKS